MEDVKSPLLAEAGEVPQRALVGSRNSVNSLRNDFVAKLPDDVRSGIDLESTSLVDLSKITRLTQGEREYYERQFATLKSFEEVDEMVTSNNIDEDDHQEQAEHERAMRISNFANILLLAFKLYATIKSGSIAIAASTLDSLLDHMAGGILWFTHLLLEHKDTLSH